MEEEEEKKKMTKEGERTEVMQGRKSGIPKRGDTNVVVSRNCIHIFLQNNLKIVLQISTRLFPELRWYLLTFFNFKIFVPYYCGSCANCAGIIVLNLKNVTALFLIAVPF